MKLDAEEIQSALKKLPGWVLLNDKLHREVKFKDFAEAFSFMAQAAIISERRNHHPEWLNIYNQVIIDLTSHDCKGISKRDVAWAEEINKVLSKYV
jgi:4a-hydroxytetrahydrobiopterin dehydratase